MSLIRDLGIRNVLILGLDLTALARSIKKLGLKVYSSGFFGDRDLIGLCEDSYSIIEQKKGQSCGYIDSMFRPDKIVEEALKINEKYGMDLCLLSSGLEDNHGLLSDLYDNLPVCGNSLRTIKAVRDKGNFFQELERLAIPHPITYIVSDLKEAEKYAGEIGYPIMLKKMEGSGGTGVFSVSNEEGLNRIYRRFFRDEKEFLVQECLEGTPMSVSLIASSGKASILSVNRQLLGLRVARPKGKFTYCGNIVPSAVDKEFSEKIRSMVEKISYHFNLNGSNGVDFVDFECTPYVIEVNPRFQGTLECMERALNINLVRAHIEACLKGYLPEIPSNHVKFCTRIILYSPRKIRVPDLRVFEEVRDIPFEGVIIEEGEPVCSIITESRSETSSYIKAVDLTISVYNYIMKNR